VRAVRCSAVSVRCFVSSGARGVRGAVFRDACGERTAPHRARCGAVRAVCAVRFFVTPLVVDVRFGRCEPPKNQF